MSWKKSVLVICTVLITLNIIMETLILNITSEMDKYTISLHYPELCILLVIQSLAQTCTVCKEEYVGIKGKQCTNNLVEVSSHDVFLILATKQ